MSASSANPPKVTCPFCVRNGPKGQLGAPKHAGKIKNWGSDVPLQLHMYSQHQDQLKSELLHPSIDGIAPQICAEQHECKLKHEHVNGDPLQCGTVEYFVDPITLKRHKEIMHHICSSCGERCGNKDALKMHKEKEHPLGRQIAKAAAAADRENAAAARAATKEADRNAKRQRTFASDSLLTLSKGQAKYSGMNHLAAAAAASNAHRGMRNLYAAATAANDEDTESDEEDSEERTRKQRAKDFKNFQSMGGRYRRSHKKTRRSHKTRRCHKKSKSRRH